MANKINRRTLEIIANLESELQTFHGIRRLWANQVANGTPTYASHVNEKLDPDTLVKEQMSLLWGMIGEALKLHDHLWGDESDGNMPITGYMRLPQQLCPTCQTDVAYGKPISFNFICEDCLFEQLISKEDEQMGDD